MNVIKNSRNSRKIFILAVTASILMICLMLGSYAYLVNKTVMNVVAREQAESKIGSLNSEVGDKEFKEMSLRNTITLDLAHQLGFNDAKNITFVDRAGTEKGLSLSR